jgi:hypothetical protein
MQLRVPGSTYTLLGLLNVCTLSSGSFATMAFRCTQTACACSKDLYEDARLRIDDAQMVRLKRTNQGWSLVITLCHPICGSDYFLIPHVRHAVYLPSWATRH